MAIAVMRLPKGNLGFLSGAVENRIFRYGQQDVFETFLPSITDVKLQGLKAQNVEQR